MTYVAGTLIIEAAPLTVSVGNYTLEIGQENPLFEITYSDWKNGVLTVAIPSDILMLMTNGLPFDIYTTSAVLVRSRATTLKGLPKDRYVVNGRKVAIK